MSGDGTLPKALGAAVDAMRVCVWLLWASPSAAAAEISAAKTTSSSSFPAPPASAAMDGVEYRGTHFNVNVRDVFGDGFVKHHLNEKVPGAAADCPPERLSRDKTACIVFQSLRLITNDETHETRKTETRRSSRPYAVRHAP